MVEAAVFGRHGITALVLHSHHRDDSKSLVLYLKQLSETRHFMLCVFVCFVEVRFFFVVEIGPTERGLRHNKQRKLVSCRSNLRMFLLWLHWLNSGRLFKA